MPNADSHRYDPAHCLIGTVELPLVCQHFGEPPMRDVEWLRALSTA